MLLGILCAEDTELHREQCDGFAYLLAGVWLFAQLLVRP